MSNNIYIAFAKDGVAFGELIKLWTLGKYAHCEVVVGAQSYSATGVEGKVRNKLINFFDKPNKWDIYRVRNLNSDAYKIVEEFYENTQGMKYDYKGVIFSQLMSIFNMHDEDKYFCSEWVAECIDRCYNGKLTYKNKPLSKYGYNKFNPNKLFKYLDKKGLLVPVNSFDWYITENK